MTRDPRTPSTIYLSLRLPLALLLVVVLITACTSSPAESTPSATPPSESEVVDEDGSTTASEPTPEITIEEMNAFWADDDPFLGPEDAPVVIVEFSDYVCPYCGYFYLHILPEILEAYPDTVRFVHRDYPLLAEESVSTSLAAACALDQDLFWELHDQLFGAHADFDPDAEGEHSPEFFSELVAKFSDEEILRYADLAGLDLEEYETCLEGGVGREEIMFDIQVGSQVGVESVPFYIVNGYVYTGLLPIEAWEQIIDAALEMADS